MKKIAILMIFIIMLLSISLDCLAESHNAVVTPESFDYEKLKTMTYVSEDDMEGRAFVYYSEDYTGLNGYTEIDGSYEETGHSSGIYSDIIVLNLGTAKELPIFRIWINYMDDEWLFADNCIIKVGNERYYFDGIDVQRDNGYSKYSGSWIEEILLIKIGDDSIPFMEALCEARKNDESVMLRLKGSKGYIDFDITSNVGSIIRLYERLKLCGGTLERYTTQFDENIQ